MIKLSAFLAGVLLALTPVTHAQAAGNAAANTESGNYRVDLAMTSGGPLLNEAADVYVLDAAGDVVARRHAVPAIFDLRKGDYTAAVVYKNAQARGPLSLGTAPGTNVLNLKAGKVGLKLVLNNGRVASVDDLSWTVYRYRAGAQQGKKVATSDARTPELTLDAGWYEVEALYGGSNVSAKTEHVVEVKAGLSQDYQIIAD